MNHPLNHLLCPGMSLLQVKETEGSAENKSRFSFNGGIDASSVRLKNRVLVTWEQIVSHCQLIGIPPIYCSSSLN